MDPLLREADPLRARSSSRGVALLVALIFSLIALLAAFLVTLQAASRHFDRAAEAQAQLAAVSRIEALAANDFPRAALDEALRDYRASIDRETALLDDDDALAGQRQEQIDADRLAELAVDSSDRLRLAALVSRIGARERAEIAEVGEAMGRLRMRMAITAGLLAVAALGAALSGAAILAHANRDLSQIVSDRTAELRAVDRSRRLFFAKVSHELRTPVTVMRGEAEVSLSDAATTEAELREALGQVIAQADFLERRIEELLGLSKAEDGRLLLALQPIDLAVLVAATADTADGFARSAEVSIDLAMSGTAIPVLADPRWLGQALLAIIDNGVKFSPQGAALRLRLDREDDGARISIADHGPGVMADALPRIFDAYYQADAGRTRGGTGLGLALARWVVEQHGGTIVAANDPAGGCTVAIHLPMAEAA